MWGESGHPNPPSEKSLKQDLNIKVHIENLAAKEQNTKTGGKP